MLPLPFNTSTYFIKDKDSTLPLLPNASTATTNEERAAQSTQTENRLNSPVEIVTKDTENPFKDKNVLQNGKAEEINCIVDKTDASDETKDVAQNFKHTIPSLRTSIEPLSKSGKGT